MSGLYRTFKENYVPYFPDGRGRDRYIAFDNAGFFHNFPKSLSPSNIYKPGNFFGTKIIQQNKSISVKAPNFHYHSDGNGRDKYILINGGGLFYESKPLLSYKLTDFLRKNENAFYSPNKKKISLSKYEMKYNQLLRSKEKELIKRLYNDEKIKFMKKKKIQPINWLSSDEIKSDNENESINKNKTNTFFLPRCGSYKIIKEKENNPNQCFTPKHKRIEYENDKNEINNNENNNINKESINNLESPDLNTLKYNRKLLMKVKNMNKSNLIQKKFIINSPCKTSREFYNDIEKIKNYQTIQEKNKDFIRNKKQPYFHILNEHSNV